MWMRNQNMELSFLINKLHFYSLPNMSLGSHPIAK